MTDTVWLASYPKSGNTWFRMLVANLVAAPGVVFDINNLPEGAGIASARRPFDTLTLIESGLLTHDEVDRLRPLVHQALAEGAEDEPDPSSGPARWLVKVHDAYTVNRTGEPLLGGARAARAAIVIVRDPRDVAPSLAHHNRWTIGQAIQFMGDAEAGFGRTRHAQALQLRQKFSGWSDHVASWLDQADIPVHVVRYEDLRADTSAVFADALRFAGRTPPPDALARAVRLTSFAELRAQEAEKGFREWRDHGNPDRRFFRRGEAGAWRDELTAEQVAGIEAAHGAMMTRLGYALVTSRGIEEHADDDRAQDRPVAFGTGRR